MVADPRKLGTVKEFSETLAKPQGTASGAPTLKTFGYKCGKCGTAVNEGQQYCEVCAPIMAAFNAPKPSMVVREVIIVKQEPSPTDGTTPTNDAPDTRGEE